MNQISCQQPPQAARAMSAMLGNRLVRRTTYGEDGIGIFVPARGLHLLGFEIVRIAGWQEGEVGGALAPFSRLPGTAPTEHIAVTVRASANDVHRELASRGIKEASYVPIPSNPAGDTRYRTPGPEVSAADYEYGAHRKLRGVVTLECRK